MKCECWRHKRDGKIIYTDPCPIHSLTRPDSQRLPLAESEKSRRI